MDELKLLLSKKDEMEMEIEGIINSLGEVGLKGNLVDSEGFPRGDIDILAIRKLRNRYAVLQTDHKDIMKKIEAGLHELHGRSKPSTTTTAATDSSSLASASAPSGKSKTGGKSNILSDIDPSTMTPMVLVESVAQFSPADEAKLLAKDKVIVFGSVKKTHGTPTSEQNPLGEIVREVERNLGNPIPIVVERGLKFITLSITPKKWTGPGYLGCKLVPI